MRLGLALGPPCPRNETATVAEHRGSVCRTTPHRGAGKSRFNVLPGRVGLNAELLNRGEDDATLDAQVGASRETVLQVIAGGITSKVPGLGASPG